MPTYRNATSHTLVFLIDGLMTAIGPNSEITSVQNVEHPMLVDVTTLSVTSIETPEKKRKYNKRDRKKY